jgi:all-trans-retinol 13,14-reductase
MLPEPRREVFMAPYRDKSVSISLFSITLGLARPPVDLGVTSYSTILTPDWVTELRDFKHCAALLADAPTDRLPVLGVCDHHQIDSGLRTDGALFTLNIVGVDRLSNWEHVDDDAYQQHRDAWLDAVIARLDTEWPALAAAVRERHMATAKTMHEILNTPGGAVYGFAPNAPDGMPRGGPLGSPTTSIDRLWLASAYSGVGGRTTLGSDGPTLTSSSALRSSPLI